MAAHETTPLCVIGAGPFGLSVAADAVAHGVEVRCLGRPMSFWREHMPAGMILRSASDWSLDPQGVHTIDGYFDMLGLPAADRHPIPIGRYLGYAEWFEQRSGVRVEPLAVTRLDVEPSGRFVVTTETETVAAKAVVLAMGLRHFAVTPTGWDGLPADRVVHTCELVDPAPYAGRRCLIVGGRQSAFETAALLQEAGATAVHVVHRHPSPAFAEADWSWATAMMVGAEDRPGWFRELPSVEQQAIIARMWGEGRLKVEPWLESRVMVSTVHLHPQRSVSDIEPTPSGALAATLDDGTRLEVDDVIAATGYKPNLGAIPFLAAGNALGMVETADGCPCLDSGFQTSVPGLYATGASAMRDFGPFMNFTLAARSSAVITGRAVRGYLTAAAGTRS